MTTGSTREAHTMPASPRPPRQPRGVAVLIGLGFAAGGLALTLLLGTGMGYGRDLHATRVAGLCGVLFVAGTLAFWPGVGQALRGVVITAGVIGGGAAWLFVPCRAEGRSFAAAISWSDRTAMRLAMHTEEAMKRLGPLQSELDDLGEDFPQLADNLRPSVKRFIELAKYNLELDFRSHDLDDLAGVRKIRERAVAFTTDFPEHKQDLDAAFEKWVKYAVEARVRTLDNLASRDEEEFVRTAPLRKAFATEFPAHQARLVAAEAGWVGRWAANERLTLLDLPDRSDVRKQCLTDANRLAQLPWLDTSPAQLREAHLELFRIAHAAVGAEIATLHDQQRFDRALGVALAHQFEWTKLPGVIGPEQQKVLDSLRERCRRLCQPGGDPDPLPPPRPIETAPTPRPKM